MSLLQEALKRKEEDDARRAAGAQPEGSGGAPPEGTAKLTLAGARPPENRPPLVPPPGPPVAMPVPEPASPQDGGAKILSLDQFRKK